ncbi:MAG: sugar ABC transporter substrate-binding protein [Lachnospiraceae bacterium]|nr:sugar ABC transporter substrate-binding protein [Lachnospiraceae bacterium]
MKKTLAIILAGIMAIALCACGGGSAPAPAGGGDAQENPSYLIGYNTWGSGIAVFEQMMIEIPYSIESLDGEATGASDDFTADTELRNIQNFVSAGVDGILMQAAASTTIAEAIKACEEAKIPLAFGIFPGAPDDRAIAQASEYYAGCGYADLVTDGYNAGKEAVEAGFKNCVIIGGNLGDPNNDDRVAGFTKAFEEEGGCKILDAARCTSPAEALEKANALLSAHRDAELIYCITSDYAPGAITAQESLGLDIPIYACSLSTEVLDYVRSGQITRTTYGNDLGQGFGVALLVNFLDGHQILDENGKAPDIAMTPFRVDADNLDIVIDLFFTEGHHPFSAKMLQELSWRYNPDVSYQTFMDMKEAIENDGLAYLDSMKD